MYFTLQLMLLAGNESIGKDTQNELFNNNSFNGSNEIKHDTAKLHSKL